MANSRSSAISAFQVICCKQASNAQWGKFKSPSAGKRRTTPLLLLWELEGGAGRCTGVVAPRPDGPASCDGCGSGSCVGGSECICEARGAASRAISTSRGFLDLHTVCAVMSHSPPKWLHKAVLIPSILQMLLSKH